MDIAKSSNYQVANIHPWKRVNSINNDDTNLANLVCESVCISAKAKFILYNLSKQTVPKANSLKLNSGSEPLFLIKIW